VCAVRRYVNERVTIVEVSRNTAGGKAT
jgi:hypothetical protein